MIRQRRKSLETSATNWIVAMANLASLAVFPASAGPAEMMRLSGILV